ncbi:methyl-accepting chemotaxis protein [Eleftheria terrae]|uniref:methyl-accepting chemotaxis protein n=1 Tax=Eleftheria terrae TaxID=1597781 RepID=UPI00263B801F|nr:methyl-accepting chemotaxis protein [Eleftheria terrae]WKB51176.1 methyl-accepting chemotaxis protein [Eleftheria terrae]
MAALVQLAARQRMLSQHLVLQALLASLGQAQALACAQETLVLFADSHTTLVQGKGCLPGAHFAEVQAAYFGAAAGDARVREFIELARETLHALRHDAQAEGAAKLQALIPSAGSLLVLLNQITQIYEAEARRCARQLQRQWQALAGQITSVAQQARAVAYSAQVLAARSGEAGRDFASVARELTQVTGGIEQLAQAAQAVSASRLAA